MCSDHEHRLSLFSDKSKRYLAQYQSVPSPQTAATAPYTAIITATTSTAATATASPIMSVAATAFSLSFTSIYMSPFKIYVSYWQSERATRLSSKYSKYKSNQNQIQIKYFL